MCVCVCVFMLCCCPQEVTKGARTKIILSIRKLARRPETLVEIEQVSASMACCQLNAFVLV